MSAHINEKIGPKSVSAHMQKLGMRRIYFESISVTMSESQQGLETMFHPYIMPQRIIEPWMIEAPDLAHEVKVQADIR